MEQKETDYAKLTEDELKVMDEAVYQNPRRKMKTTKCIWCNKEIFQGKKEGIMFCEECRNKYEQIIKDSLSLIPELVKCEHIGVYSGNSNTFGNRSDKNTIVSLHPFRDIKYFDTWLDTDAIVKLIGYGSQYIGKYIEHQLEASYYFALSVGEYRKKITEQEQEAIKEAVKALYPQYQADQLKLKDLAKTIGISKSKIERIIEQLEVGK